MRVLFLGSPEFAVPSLNIILESNNHEIVGVITQPDRPAGRGMKLKSPAVKEAILDHNLPLLQPESINATETIDWMTGLQPDILVVVAYGEFLGKKVLQMCRYQPVNVHPSLLPQLRGAAPIQWTLLHGHVTGGVTTQYMVSKMDAGDVLLQTTTPIAEHETAADLHDRMAKLGADLLLQTLDQIEAATITPTPQIEANATFAPLLKKEDGAIAWEQSSLSIHNRVRALHPWPGAFTTWNGQMVKIRRTSLVDSTQFPPQRCAPGAFIVHRDNILVATGDGWLAVHEVQPSGKRPMLPAEFANGIRGQRENSILQFD